LIDKGRAIDVKQVGRELGVRYVLEGSVRKSANRVRITGQLIDASSGAHIWADRFDGAIEDIFDLQDQVTASVVGAMAPKMEQAEIERATRKPTANLDAYDYYLQGLTSKFCRDLTSNFVKVSDPGRRFSLLNPWRAIGPQYPQWFYFGFVSQKRFGTVALPIDLQD
jgi:hypothetical protein